MSAQLGYNLNKLGKLHCFHTITMVEDAIIAVHIFQQLAKTGFCSNIYESEHNKTAPVISEPYSESIVNAGVIDPSYRR